MAKEKDKIEHFAYLKMVDGQRKLMDKLISAVGENKANQMYDQIIEKLSDENDIKADEIDSFVTQLAENNNATKKLVSDVFVSIKMVEEAKKKVDKNYVDTQNAVNNAVIDANQVSYSHTYFLAQPGNKYYENISDLMLNQPNSLKATPNYGPKVGSPLRDKSTQTLFSDAKLQDAFFQKVDYIGAFKSDAEQDNWLKNWTNFDPQNTAY